MRGLLSAVIMLLAHGSPASDVRAAQAGSVTAQAPDIIDAHVHLDAQIGRGATDWSSAARRAIEGMGEAGIRVSVVVPPPQPPGFPVDWECDRFGSALRAHTGRFAIMCGGGSINRLIYENAASAAEPRIAARIGEMVEKFAAQGAVAIGEIAAEHFSLDPRHPYLSLPADHALLLHLADAAARHRLPVALHLEAVATPFVMPDGLRQASPMNPARIAENISGFERLLAHNREARFVWVHFGWDNTRQRTPGLMRELLARHSNLYVSIKIQSIGPPSRPYLDAAGELNPEFIAAIEAFPDRFVIGSGAFYAARRLPAEREIDRVISSTRKVLERLTPATQRKVAFENAVALYRLRERGLVP